jgi:hypothetical protein
VSAVLQEQDDFAQFGRRMSRLKKLGFCLEASPALKVIQASSVLFLKTEKAEKVAPPFTARP